MQKIRYNRIKLELTKHGVTNRQLSEALRIRPTTVSRWCTNDSQPSLPMFFKIAGYLNVDVRSLVNRTALKTKKYQNLSGM